MGFGRQLKRKKVKELGKRTRSKTPEAKETNKKLAARFLTEDEFLEDVLISLISGFAKQVMENERIEDDELIKGIAKHTIGFFSDTEIVFRDPGKMKNFIQYTVDPLFSTARTSASIMLIICIKHLLDETKNNIAEYAFSAIKEFIDRMYDAYTRTYLEELNQNQTALKLILGVEILKYADKKAIKKLKESMDASLLPNDLGDVIEKQFEKVVEMAYLTFTPYHPDVLLLAIWLRETYGNDTSKAEAFITKTIKPYFLKVGSNKTKALELYKDIIAGKNTFILSKIFEVIDKGGLEEEHILLEAINRASGDSFNDKVTNSFETLKAGVINSIVAEYPSDIVDVYEYKINSTKDFVLNMTLKSYRARVKKLKLVKGFKDERKAS